MNRSTRGVICRYPSLVQLRNFNRFLDPINNENQRQNVNEVENDENNIEDAYTENSVSYF